MIRNTFVLSLLLATLHPGVAGAASYPRTYVQSNGSDANVAVGCAVASPCRSFQAAVDIADDGGEVIALDSEDFGPVRVAKSITIIGNDGRAGILVPPAEVGIEIAKADVQVVLRGLYIAGSGSGGTGVHLKEGASLQVERCALTNFLLAGIVVDHHARVRIADSVLSGNGSGAMLSAGVAAVISGTHFIGNRGSGLQLVGNTEGTTSATVTGSIASHNGLDGFSVGTTHRRAVARLVVEDSTASHNRWGFMTSAREGEATIMVGRSSAAHNEVGFARIPGTAGVSTFESMGDNHVRHNTTATMGSVTTVPSM